MADSEFETDFTKVSLSSWCIFCLRNYNLFSSDNEEDSETDTDNQNRRRLGRFLKLFWRYTGRGTGEENQRDDFSQVFNSLSEKRSSGGDDYGTCEDCSLVLQDFCDFYEKVTVLEMKMDWKLQTLESIMRSADKVPTRLKNIQEKLEVKENMLQRMKEFRKNFVKRTSKKLKSATPRVKLRCQTSLMDNLGADKIGDGSCCGPSLNQKSTGRNVSNDEVHLKPGINTARLCNVPNEFMKTEETPQDLGADADVIINDEYMEDVEESYDIGLDHSPPISLTDDNNILPSTKYILQLPMNQNEAEHITSSELKSAEIIGFTNPIANLEEIAVIKPFIAMDYGEKVRNLIEDKSSGSGNHKLENPRNSILRPGETSHDIFASKSEVSDNELIMATTNDDDTSGPEETETSSDHERIQVKTEACHGDDEDDCIQRSSIRLRKRKITSGIQNLTLKLPKRKCVRRKSVSVARSRNTTDESTSTSAPASLPSLKELALNHVLKLRFGCSVPKCISSLKTFYNHDDFLRHSLYHGKFPCQFCNKEEEYAPNLCKHEIDNHAEKLNKKYKCPRCNFSSRTISTLKMHHLKSHLKLMPNRRTCEICQCSEPGGTFDTKLQLARDHYFTHHDLTGVDLETVKKCMEPNCRAYFREEDQLNQHLALVHKIESFKFKINRKITQVKAFKTIFRKKKMLHWTKKLSLSPYAMEKMSCQKPCGKCTDVFYCDEDLEVHSKLHGEFQCNFCEFSTDFVISLFHHEMSSHSKGNSTSTSCPRLDCDFSLPINTQHAESKLIKHFVEAHYDTSIDYQSCPVCNVKLSNRCEKKETLLQAHLKTCHDFSTEIFQCEEPNCLVYFNVNKEMLILKHRNDHKVLVDDDPNEENKFLCNECSKRFVSRDSLLEHVRYRHSSEKRLKSLPFPCPSDGCDLRFETQEELDIHKETKGMVVCPECGKCYHGKHGLISHMAMHKRAKGPEKKKKKVLICEICGKEFKDKKHLQNHSLSHSGPESWQFSCEICGKKCLTKGKLKEHMRMHTKEKPYACEFCGVRYAHRHNLRIHINIKHGDIATDIPKNFDKSRLVSRKGIKLRKSKPSLKVSQERETLRVSRSLARKRR